MVLTSTSIPQSIIFNMHQCVLEWMTRLKCFLGFQRMLSEEKGLLLPRISLSVIYHLYSLLVVVANVSHCCNDEGYDGHSSNSANYNCHHVLFWKQRTELLLIALCRGQSRSVKERTITLLFECIRPICEYGLKAFLLISKCSHTKIQPFLLETYMWKQTSNIFF